MIRTVFSLDNPYHDHHVDGGVWPRSALFGALKLALFCGILLSWHFLTIPHFSASFEVKRKAVCRAGVLIRRFTNF